MADPTTAEADRIRAYFRGAAGRASDARHFLVAERRVLLDRLVRRRGIELPDLRVCDVGCGGGGDLRHWRSVGVRATGLFGTELVAGRADAARAAVPGATVARVDGFEVPFADESFDLVTAALVLSSIRDPNGRARLVEEMRRVTRPGGLLAIYDFRVRKPSNRNVVAVGRRELEAILGPGVSEYRLAPFLPLLDLALRLPAAIRDAVVGALPRTHRLWVWTRSA